MTKPTKREGEPGTWSHCGNHEPHTDHYHTVVFNEGPYPDVHCLGSLEPPQPPKPDHYTPTIQALAESYAGEGRNFNARMERRREAVRAIDALVTKIREEVAQEIEAEAEHPRWAIESPDWQGGLSTAATIARNPKETP